MATVGQALTAPEIGWKRIDNTDKNITYTGTWGTSADTGNYNSTLHYTDSNTAYLTFSFKGTKIRLISYVNTNKRPNNVIEIDGVSETFSEYNATGIYHCLVYEKTGLPNTVHTVRIRPPADMTTSFNLTLDAIDVDDVAELRPPYNKLLILSSDGETKSVKDDYMISLSSNSEHDFINHGIDNLMLVDLSNSFNKKQYIKHASNALGIGKTYEHTIDLSKYKVNKIKF